MRLTRICMLTAAMAASTYAGTFDLNSGSFQANTGGVALGRGIGFQALSTTTITSVAIEADLVRQDFEVVLFASTNGSNSGAVLGTAQAFLGGSGFGFNTISTNFNVAENQFYALLWRPAVSSTTWATTLAYYFDSALPTTVGPFKLIDGLEGFSVPNFTNALHPNLRVTTTPLTVIPEPGSVALVVLGLGLVAARRLRA